MPAGPQPESEAAAAVTIKEDIYQYLVHLIDCKPLPPGSTIPSEAALGLSFGCARETVRRAVDDLVAEGRLVRVRGTGTFVTESNTGPQGPLVGAELGRLRQIEALVRDLFQVEDEMAGLRPSAVSDEDERDEAEIEARLRELVGMALPAEPVLHHQRRCPFPAFECTCRRSHLLAEAYRLSELIGDLNAATTDPPPSTGTRVRRGRDVPPLEVELGKMEGENPRLKALSERIDLYGESLKDET